MLEFLRESEIIALDLLKICVLVHIIHIILRDCSYELDSPTSGGKVVYADNNNEYCSE